MSLPDAYVGARHTGLQVTWEHSNHTPYDFTDAEITATIRNKLTNQSVAADGDFTKVDPPKGRFDWAYGPADVGTPGQYTVQFIATYADNSFDVSVPRDWKVLATN